MASPILFYQVNKQFGFFSNFSAHPIVLNDKVWATSEHYFQAMKFAGTPFEEEVRLAHSPSEAARLGRDRNLPLRLDWELVKIDVMRRALEAKFNQYPELMQQLLETKNAEIIEHTSNDSFWGDGGDGSGKNMLGILLMELRAKFH